MSISILLYCRAGFETECSREFSDCAKVFGSGEVKSAAQGSGFVLYGFQDQKASEDCMRELLFSSLTFSRQMVAVSDAIGPLAAGDRVAPLIREIQKMNFRFSDFFIETADTNEAKQLSPLCTKLSGPVFGALEKEGLLPPDKGEKAGEEKRLHIFFIATDRAYAGYSLIANSSPWHRGIPRLKFPAAAPSRSTLKLEEAFHVFLSEKDRAGRLRRGLTAIDLGASPGGWTWQFVNRGIRVIAVDNGAMDASVLDSGLVRHIRGDGFTYAPKRPVDWMVCDIVEQPSRIARLAAQWVARKWCAYAIFNLKLPMKKRYEEVRRCREIIASELGRVKMTYSLSVKQLYHDREEVTGYLRRGF